MSIGRDRTTSSASRTEATRRRSNARKIYVALADAEAERTGFVRVIDESGTDSLYPKRLFAAIHLSPHVAQVLGAGA